VDDAKAEKSLEGVKITVSVKQAMVSRQTERCDDAVVRSANRMAAGAKGSIIPTRGDREGHTSGVEHLKLQQVTLDSFQGQLATDPVQNFAQNQISQCETLLIDFPVQPNSLRIQVSCEVVDPDRGIDDRHGQNLILNPAGARLV